MNCTTRPATFEAFEAVERGRALKYTAALVGAEAAQDIVQEALLVVWKKWDTLTGNPAGFLYGTCKNLVFGEYRDRGRGPVLLAELPQQPHQDDNDQDESAKDAALLNVVWELGNQEWSSEATPAVGAGLAAGMTKAEVAERLQVPLSEVHRSARELRRYYKARSESSGPTGPENTYTPHGLVTQAMRRLSRREREVMALAALGLKPHLIGPLIKITGGSARTTLCHARKAVAAAVVLPVEDTPDVVDHFVRNTLDPAELLHMLPNVQWRAEALRRTTSENRYWFFFFRHRPQRPVAYLTEMSKVLAVVREGLEASNATAVYGSVRWVQPVERFVPFRAYVTSASAFRGWQVVDSRNRNVAANGIRGDSCLVPSWTAPSRVLILVPPMPEPCFDNPFTSIWSDFIREAPIHVRVPERHEELCLDLGHEKVSPSSLRIRAWRKFATAA